jgi:N-acyl-L-homoserine lactone synthetase
MDEQSYIKALDDIAARFVAMNPGLRFGVAQSTDERDAIFHLRYQEVIGRGWSKPDEYPDGQERDEYDDDASLIGAWEGDALAGCARLIFPVADRPLPIESSFNIVIEPRDQVVYLSRILVAPVYRAQGQHHLLLGLLGMSWIELRAKGFYHLCGAFSASVMPVFQKVGVHVVPLGTQDYLGETRHACYIDMRQTAQSLRKNIT